MKERLLTLGCALGALALFYAIFLPKPQTSETRYSQPTTVERRGNGYAGALHWLSAEGVRVESLRKRYDSLNRVRPRSGNLLVTTMPHRYGVRAEEDADLSQWVANGNTVLVLAAMADTPDWTMPYAGTRLPEDIRELTGVGFEVPLDARAEESGTAGSEGAKPDGEDPASEQQQQASFANTLQRLREPQRHRMAPNRSHPLFAGVRTVVAESEFPAAQWRAIAPPGGALLSLAHDADTGRDGFWVRNHGKGRYLISAYGSIFANEHLGEAGNARLLANIVGQSLGPQGGVLFDDQHQGLSDLYDAEAFFGDKRLHLTLWLLLALWFVWVLGGVRLRPAPPEPPPPRETAFVEATGGLLARVLRPSQAAARLFELFFNELRRRLGLVEDGRPVWDWLERQTRVERSELQALRAFEARLARGRRVDLIRLQNLIAKVQGRV